MLPFGDVAQAEVVEHLIPSPGRFHPLHKKATESLKSWFPDCPNEQFEYKMSLGYCSSIAPANRLPPVAEFDVQLGCLHGADEHEDEASPSADDLDHPSLPDGGEDGVLFSTAVGDVPENIASHAAFARRPVNWPRRVGQASRGAICFEWHH